MFKTKLLPGEIISSIFILLVLLTFSCTTTEGGNSSQSDSDYDIVYYEGFEDSKKGWAARGGESILISSDYSQSGEKSLLVTDRTSTWNGPIREMSRALKPGRSYLIGVWAKFDKGPDTIGLKLSIQRNVDGEGDVYTNIGGTELVKGEWIYTEVTYSVPPSDFVTPINLYFETTWKEEGAAEENDLIPFYIDDITISKLPPPPPAAAEKDIPAFSSFYPEFRVGVAVKSTKYFDNSNKYNELLRHFNGFVFENDMKMDAMQPTEGNFIFSKAEKMITYANDNNSVVRGHTLLWHNQHPKWFFSGSDGKDVNKEILLKRIKSHIQTIAGELKGQVYAWDVANEVLEETGELRDSKYLQIIGSEEYIAKAFIWAREADPDAKLFLNDYNVSYAGPKQDGLYNLVKRLLDQGVPIDGVGFQAHINIGFPSVNAIRESIKRFANLGLEVHITELDISIYKSSTESSKEADKEVLLNQAYKYRALFEMFREEAIEGNLTMVTLWGLSDDNTWLNNFPVQGRANHPLLFDRNLKAKPAYWATVDPGKLSVFIKNIEALASDHDVMGPEDGMWNDVTFKEILDVKGGVYGSVGLLWSGDNLYVKANIIDDTVDNNDSISLYLEANNLKTAKITNNTLIVDIPRSEAIDNPGVGYTVFYNLPLSEGSGKLNKKVGFDLKIANNGDIHSFNDYSNSQNESTANYSSVTLTKLAPIATAVSGSVNIDGVIDSSWDNAIIMQLEVETEGITEGGSRFRTLWDEDYIYVLIEVKDSLLDDNSANPWEQDSVEVFIDENNAKTEIYEADDAQYRVSYNNSVSFNGGDRDGFKSAAAITEDGYIVEVAIPMSIAQLGKGTIIGFDVQINESDSTSVRTGIRNWVSDTNLGYQNTSDFGVLKLDFK